MMVRRYIFSIIIIGWFSSTLFSENNFLWDFGVIIKKPNIDNNPTEMDSQYLIKNHIEKEHIKAVISDPFIPPIKNTFSSNLPESFEYKFHKTPDILDGETNIFLIVSMAEKYYFKGNYYYVIELLYQKNLNLLSDQSQDDLQYLLAMAFYHTGRYKEAQEQVLYLLTQNKSERLYLLLAMIYESLGEKKTAKDYYLKLISQYPNSDYTISAKIKSKILDQH